MLKAYAKDYLDLMAIAIMIEKEESHKKITEAIQDLDTIVRDEIPNVVYDFYCKE